MAGISKLKKASIIALRDYMGLTEEETLLVLCDENKREIGLALFEAGKELCTEAFYAEMKSRGVAGEEPPEQIASMMESVDLVICPTTKSLTHTNARRRASKQGVRIATMPGITTEIMVRCLAADYEEIITLSQNLFNILKTSSLIKVVTAAGTNISFVSKGRKIIKSTGVMRNIGESGNLPSGEVYMSPKEGTANGTIIYDGSLGEIGLIKDPVEVKIENGYATKISGKAEAKKLSAILNKIGGDALALAEFGIGTNPKAQVTGEILEDEKALGTIHFAFGNNITMGGTINVPIHLDGILLEPTVYVDDIKIMEKGKILVYNNI